MRVRVRYHHQSDRDSFEIPRFPTKAHTVYITYITLINKWQAGAHKMIKSYRGIYVPTSGADNCSSFYLLQPPQVWNVYIVIRGRVANAQAPFGRRFTGLWNCPRGHCLTGMPLCM